MQGLRFAAAAAILLLMAACIDAGPQTDAQVRQDISSTGWARNAMPPVLPGLQPPAETGGTTDLAVP